MLKLKFLLRRLSVLLIGTSFLLLLPAVLNGQVSSQLEVHAGAGKVPTMAVVGLRPNVATSMILTLRNPDDDDLRNVVVKLVQVGENVKILGQTQEIDKLPARSTARLMFLKSKEKTEKKDKDAADGKDKKDKEGPDPLELVGPPFNVQLWVEAKTVIRAKKDVQFVIREPHDYLSAQGQYDQARRMASFKVRFSDPANVTGPGKCLLELVPGPELESGKKGTFMQSLTDRKQTVDLFAEDLAFPGLKGEGGRVYLTADGYERAFIFPVSLAGSGTLDELPLGQNVGARIRAARYTKPMEKFPVTLEMDGPTSGDYRVELGLDRAGTKGEFEFKTFQGLRQQKIILSFTDAGELVCNTGVRDWQTEFDTSGVYGDIFFRVRVFKKNELVNLLPARETRFHLTSQEISTDGKRLFARVTQDDRAPQDVDFVNLPKVGYVGRRMPVQVKVRVPRPNQAPIEKKLLFFRGKPGADGKINPEAIIGTGDFDPRSGLCSVILPAPEKTEPLELSVQVTTAAGVSVVKTGNITIREAKVAPAVIKGVVAHGGNGQPGIAVNLTDEKGKSLVSVKSGPRGDFVFNDVLPGKYFVYAIVNFPPLVGSSKVEVAEGQELVDNVALRLLAK